jgi:hypothetical protein
MLPGKDAPAPHAHHRLMAKSVLPGSASGYGESAAAAPRRCFLMSGPTEEDAAREQRRRQQKIQQQLDEALAESSPASDPVSIVTSGEEEDWGTEPSAPAPPAPKP